MQKQVTIFGTEEAYIEGPAPLSLPSDEMLALFSDTVNRPLFIPTKGNKGRWLIGLEKKSYAVASGTTMGITGKWTVKHADSLTVDLFSSWLSGFLGQGLMDTRCLKVYPSPEGTVTVQNMGVFGVKGVIITFEWNGLTFQKEA